MKEAPAMEQIRLLPLERADCEQLINWVNEAGERLFWQWGGGAVFHYPLDQLQLDAHLQTARGPNPIRHLFKAVDGAGQMVGYLELNRIDYERRSALLSRVLVGRHEDRGKGLGRQMAAALIALAFGEMDLQTLTLGVFDFNHGAIHLYEQLGFTREGEQQLLVPFGETWTSIRMRLTRQP
jgi:RimJ/RimL family protein N-acetyltransferase